MNTDLLVGLGIALAVVLLVLSASVRIVNEYERGVIFRLGRVISAKGPGLFFIIPIVDRMVKVSLRRPAPGHACRQPAGRSGDGRPATWLPA